jgi:putative tryptophan/tyrosine transport system substrate-binding protein
MRRREFIAGLGGTAVWPLALQAQEPARLKRVGYVGGHIEDAYGRALIGAFREGLAARGWIEGRNIEIIDRYGAADPERSRVYVAEMLKLIPEVIVSAHGGTIAALLKQTSTIPIVASQMADPVANGWVKSIARPGGNLTGFANGESALGAKSLELLKEAAPAVTRVLILAYSAAALQANPIEAAATSKGMASTTNLVREAPEIERAIADFSRQPNGGMIVMGGPELSNLTPTIVEAAIRHRLPAIYPTRDYVISGGLMSYAIDILDQYRRAGAYVDRILKGAKVSELPIQFPTRYELIVNVKTAKAIGLTIPEASLLRADELIE